MVSDFNTNFGGSADLHTHTPIHPLLIWTEVPFLQEVSGAYTYPILDTDELKMASPPRKVSRAFKIQIPGLNQHRFWWLFFSVYSLVFISFDEDISNTRDSVPFAIQTDFEFHHEYSAARRIFNSLLVVWISRWKTVSLNWYITSLPNRVERERLI